MYSGQVLRGAVNRPIPDLLDTLRQEHDNMGQEMSVFKAQRDDFERKRVLPTRIVPFSSLMPSLANSCILAWQFSTASVPTSTSQIGRLYCCGVPERCRPFHALRHASAIIEQKSI